MSIERVGRATEQRPCKFAFMVMGDLNVNITDPERNGRDEAILVALLGV